MDMLSLAPTLVNILSIIENFICFAGTKLPIWANIVTSAVCLSIADFPDILGPVIMIIC